MNARIFVGPVICRDKLWIDTSVDFSTCIFMATGYLKIVPWLLRPLAAPFVPYIRRIHAHHRTAQKLLIPEILRRREEKQKWTDKDGSYERDGRREDMIDWIEETATGAELEPKNIVSRQLGLAFAGTDGTTNHIVNTIYDLAARWDEYGADLRQEAEESLREDGGVVQKTTVNRLSKLDSFMKESQRFNPLSARAYRSHS
jgi:cytochrome P450